MEAGAGSGVGELVKMINATPSLVYPPRAAGSGAGEETGDGNPGTPSKAAASSSSAARGGVRKRTSSRPLSKSGGAGADADGPSASAASSQHALTRPVICICNDPYAPALRELRPLAQVVEFGHTGTSRLVERLKAICRAENLTVSGETLRSLAAATDNDIRSCLNTLQVPPSPSLGHRVACCSRSIVLCFSSSAVCAC
jgi:hypothetical protein